ncbi:hypothetical protein FQR65_LT08118 [Abscondita terminalis]|nr:hypothetical protein FQR65_LT08118 [Abscondita terminalis]
MFKYVVVATLIILGIVNASQLDPYIVHYIAEKCSLISSNETRQIQLMNTYQCQVLHHQLKSGEDYYRFYCERKFGKPCAEIIVPYFVECLNSEEQYISNFLISSFQEIITHMCSKDKLEFLNVFNNLEKVECIANETFSDLTINCFDTVFKKDDQSEFVLSQPFVCGRLPEFKICLEEAAQINCESNLLSDFLSDFFHPLVNWCKTN